MNKLKELQEVGIKLYSLADKFIELHDIAVELQDEFANTCVTFENFDEYEELYGLLGRLAFTLNVDENNDNRHIREAYWQVRKELKRLIWVEEHSGV